MMEPIKRSQSLPPYLNQTSYNKINSFDMRKAFQDFLRMARENNWLELENQKHGSGLKAMKEFLQQQLSQDNSIYLDAFARMM